MQEEHTSIKWRSSSIARVAVASSTITAFALVVAAPFKWYFSIRYLGL